MQVELISIRQVLHSPPCENVDAASPAQKSAMGNCCGSLVRGNDKF